MGLMGGSREKAAMCGCVNLLVATPVYSGFFAELGISRSVHWGLDVRLLVATPVYSVHWGLGVRLLVATPRLHVCVCACGACGDGCVACGDVCVACGDGDVKHKHAFFYSNSCVACGDSCQIQTETRGRICEYKQTARTCAASRVRVSTVKFEFKLSYESLNSVH